MFITTFWFVFLVKQVKRFTGLGLSFQFQSLNFYKFFFFSRICFFNLSYFRLWCVCLMMENHSVLNEEMSQHNVVYSNNATTSQLKKTAEMRNPMGFDMRWTQEEQTIMDHGLARYSSLDSDSTISRYTRISLELPNKTTRDVAMRCRWINSNSAHRYVVVSDLLEQNEQFLDQISTNLTLSNLMENLTLFNESRENIMRVVKSINENVPERLTHMLPLPESLSDDLFLLIVSFLPQSYHSYHDE